MASIMSDINYNEMASCALQLIEDENLPPIIELNFHTRAVKGRTGVCSKLKLNGTTRYKIRVATYKVNFVLCKNGRYINKHKVRFRKGDKALIPYQTLVNTLCHELAHLKYWNHRKDHKLYTKKLISKFNIIMTNKTNNEVNQQ